MVPAILEVAFDRFRFLWGNGPSVAEGWGGIVCGGVPSLQGVVIGELLVRRSVMAAVVCSCGRAAANVDCLGRIRWALARWCRVVFRLIPGSGLSSGKRTRWI